jgi:hypothetical protein
MPPNLNVKIGDITTTVEWKSEHFDLAVPQSYQPFISDGQSDLRLGLHFGTPEQGLGSISFDSSPIWRLYRSADASIVNIFHAYPGLQRFLVLPLQFIRADLYFTAPDGQFIDPFFGPTMELLMINYLAQGYGVILHACGVDFNGNGLLFTGESGAGKSTLANLWDRETAATVLSDDRTIVRRIDGEFRMFGTPWHGEAKFGSSKGVKLEKIYFLRHGPKNEIRPLTKIQSVLKMLQCSFPPFWDATGMEFSMGLFEQLATCVSCNELAFRPDESVIQFVASFA